MPDYGIKWSKKAKAYFLRLDKTTQRRIDGQIKILAAEPDTLSLDITPLTGLPGIYRLRVGSYRVVYSRDDEIEIIEIVMIGPRGEIYKIIKDNRFLIPEAIIFLKEHSSWKDMLEKSGNVGITHLKPHRSMENENA